MKPKLKRLKSEKQNQLKNTNKYRRKEMKRSFRNYDERTKEFLDSYIEKLENGTYEFEDQITQDTYIRVISKTYEEAATRLFFYGIGGGDPRKSYEEIEKEREEKRMKRKEKDEMQKKNMKEFKKYRSKFIQKLEEGTFKATFKVKSGKTLESIHPSYYEADQYIFRTMAMDYITNGELANG